MAQAGIENLLFILCSFLGRQPFFGFGLKDRRHTQSDRSATHHAPFPTGIDRAAVGAAPVVPIDEATGQTEGQKAEVNEGVSGQF